MAWGVATISTTWWFADKGFLDNENPLVIRRSARDQHKKKRNLSSVDQGWRWKFSRPGRPGLSSARQPIPRLHSVGEGIPGNGDAAAESLDASAFRIGPADLLTKGCLRPRSFVRSI